MNFTQEERDVLIAHITEKINNNNNLLIIVSSIDDEQTEADTILSAIGKWSLNSIHETIQSSFNDLLIEANKNSQNG